MTAPSRPPSVDKLARSLNSSGLPHPICVDVARAAIEAGDPDSAARRADEFRRTLLTPVVNATGVLLHTNLGRAPLAHHQDASAQTVEFNLDTGQRGSRQAAVGQLYARLCGAEAAMVVNNNAAAVLLVVAALAAGKDVPVSRGESVEIGGSFRVPEVIEQSGARLVDVGTTNRTRLRDYEAAITRANVDAAMVLKVHPSNYRVEGFVEETSIADLATLDVPVVADIGSGLIDATVPWMKGAPPAWLAGEPAAVQAIADGADLITFSADKLLGGPQAGIIAGRADLVERCLQHPLARALRPGGLVLAALQRIALIYLDRQAGTEIPFWKMVGTPLVALEERAAAVVEAIVAVHPSARVERTEALPGAGSAPGVTMPSVGVVIDGDLLEQLRRHDTPVIARSRDDRTSLDFRSVDPADDVTIVAALRGGA
ncbi:MAG: L-seryl-tRNA(Sec) selenium transferase [Ilumatobacter sp.]|jgi:L-seryl-tRNA(Ser) seleniumtransferase|uniref:L-seryl-tRNA(Sec) selenium transferase n=2 Tax=Ilumatobacter sp. TaxID=1967498 RepID=UPI002A3417BB|nr:L-seryl-tRNA(Sec) selenium transferase [Ilumatobacter sp.]MDG1391604.1 L-seryl-tRNA(Sec) selenium transferase [Ilumatobacter sp.]MDG1786598.1 L-seryl-tRNA(Sec) selenium transferase [Ilumatobacter sp.]MDG2232412.1 L-seryl-tRNA(Sec) selenium transferase [Ilumatobacter sp.]